MRGPRWITTIGAFAILWLGSCTGEAPRIVQVFWQLNAVQDRAAESLYESLTLFVHVEDADGAEDLATIYLLHDRDELFWQLDSDEWARHEESDEVWVGSNDISMPTNEGFPRGRYRLEVVDQAGERDRSEIYLSAEPIALSEIRFPEAQVTDGAVTIRSLREEHSLWFYDSGDLPLKVFPTNARRVPLDSVLNQRDRESARTLYLYVYDETMGIGIISGPYELQDS